ncbi:hypothetical protein BJV74DRAFT_970700 [Russula compacta]|nr:hypothetical protein BJV74DRAFT_970700 [Russula compacta]
MIEKCSGGRVSIAGESMGARGLLERHRVASGRARVSRVRGRAQGRCLALGRPSHILTESSVVSEQIRSLTLSSFSSYPHLFSSDPAKQRVPMLGRTTFVSTIWTLFFTSRFHQIAATPSFLPQGFLFDWNPPGTTVPIPITQQCETLAITWERGSTGVGPNPVPPYYLQIFTSIFTVPIIVPAGPGTSFNFPVPFSPGTQYQICMWDSTGVSGGCQDIYTVIPNTNASSVSCQNVTLPTTALSVNAAVTGGSFSEYGWIPQCTDIQVQPNNGTPPYTLTVAPTLHPPLNITSPNNDPINWTVSLSHGFPFFISFTDSQGYGWTQGPLHSGDNADTACLDINHSEGSSSSHNLPVTVGATVGGVVLGLLAGALGMFVFGRRRASASRDSKPREDLIRDSQLIQSQSPREISSTVGPTNLTSSGGLEYLVEPFAMPTSSSSSDPSVPLLPGAIPVSPPADATSASGSGSAELDQARRQNIYVVHHDGGRAPVTVYTEEGTEVVELPPRYPDGSTSAPSESEASRETHRRRDPAATPRKSRGPRSPV